MASGQQEQLLNLDSRDLVFDLREPIFANSIAFNGVITTDFTDVGGGYIAFDILAGKEKIEMPLLLIKGTLEDVKKQLRKDDKIAGLGFLKKIQNQFVIEVFRVDRILTQEEIDKLQ